MESVIAFVRREPALVIGFVEAVVALGMAFGLNMSVEQIGAVLAVINVALAIVTRSQVTPIAKLEDLGLDNRV